MDSDNLRAIALMVAAMAAFAIEDFLIKSASVDFSGGQMLVVLSAGGAVIFAVMCRRARAPLTGPAFRHPLVIVRNLAEVGATLCYVSSLTLIPLSLASAILQATPIFVTMGAALWLREPVGWRRWSAVVLGLIGVLVILRPGLEGFRPAALLAVTATILLAIRDVASRRIPARISSVQLSFWAYASLVPASCALAAFDGWEAAPAASWGLLLAAVGIGALAYFLLVGATRIGDVTAVIPFRYSRLIFALVLGIAFLGERPDLPTLLGAAIVIGSGLYALLRERRRVRALSMAGPTA